jgi:hypothetical protein
VTDPGHPERFDVVAHPLQGDDLILHAEVGTFRELFVDTVEQAQVHLAEGAEAWLIVTTTTPRRASEAPSHHGVDPSLL